MLSPFRWVVPTASCIERARGNPRRALGSRRTTKPLPLYKGEGKSYIHAARRDCFSRRAVECDRSYGCPTRTLHSKCVKFKEHRRKAPACVGFFMSPLPLYVTDMMASLCLEDLLADRRQALTRTHACLSSAQGSWRIPPQEHPPCGGFV